MNEGEISLPITTKKQLINQLKEMEAIADLLQLKATEFKTKCHKARQKLEGASTHSNARKGNAGKYAMAVARRNARLYKQSI